MYAIRSYYAIDNQGIRVRYIQSGFNNGCAQKDIDLAVGELRHVNTLLDAADNLFNSYNFV